MKSYRHLIGKWAVCTKGVIGKIELITRGTIPKAKGISLTGKKWETLKPLLLAEEDQEEIEATFRRKAMRVM